MALFALRLDDGDRYDTTVAWFAHPPAVGEKIDVNGDPWRVEECHELQLKTPDGLERATQLVCRPAH